MELRLIEIQQWAGDYLWPILFFLMAINLLTFTLFALDKFRAQAGGEYSRQRIPEKTLLTLALFGGSPAMILGQKLLRHKTRKQPFVALLIAVVMLQIVFLVIFGYFSFFMASAL